MAQQRPYDQSMKGVSVGDRGPSTSKVIAAVTMLPVGGTLLFISGLILTGTVFLLAISTPVFILFSPVLVPAGLVIGLAVTGFLTAGGFGITALSSVSWMANYLRQMTGTWPRQLMRVRGAAQETQKTREAGQIITSKSPETTSGKT